MGNFEFFLQKTEKKTQRNHGYVFLFALDTVLCLLILAGCYRPAFNYDPWSVPPQIELTEAAAVLQTESSVLPSSTPTFSFTRAPGVALSTPNVPKALPTLRADTSEYVVVSGDSLPLIAFRHQVSVAQVLKENPDIENPSLIIPGQKLLIPPASANEIAPNFKIIPDSELFYSPSAVGFDTAGLVAHFGGKLAGYTELLEDESQLNGAEIVQRVADEFSVNPRLLLAVLEYRSGWLSQEKPALDNSDYPLGLQDKNRKGLYKQLAWAANEMTRGYTWWEQNSVAVWTLADGTAVRLDPSINGGTAGLQYMLGLLMGKEEWKVAVSADGFYASYEELFGAPFAFSIDPLVPLGLEQAALSLPFLPGETWYFTGGPHPGWGTGSAWAGLDFAPKGEEYGCYDSDAVVTAAAAGLVVRAGRGVVVLDLDGDGIEQTGWSLLYLHLAEQGRPAEGTYVNQGDPIGYPSCEGGVSSGTHLHLARRYNGVWIAADGEIPFILGGWHASGTGIEYNGYLRNDERTVEAFNGRSDINAIWW